MFSIHQGPVELAGKPKVFAMVVYKQGEIYGTSLNEKYLTWQHTLTVNENLTMSNWTTTQGLSCRRYSYQSEKSIA